jgi:intracellular septation protein A
MSLLGPMNVLPNGVELRPGADGAASGRTRAARDEAMLVAAGCEDQGAGRDSISKLRVLKMVGRRSLPALIEATVIPSILFYVFLVSVGPLAAMCATLAWSYGSVLRRIVGGQRIPGVLQLSVAGLTVRTIVGLVSGTFMYFLQPVATTLALALVFLASLRFGRPMIARMASDFCPLESEISGRPAVIRLFSGLTLMWAGVHLLSAGTTFAMLVSLPTTTFVALKSFVSLAITISAVLLTVSWAMRTARSENLVFAAVRASPSEN